jgi:dienelactone hydrolase
MDRISLRMNRFFSPSCSIVFATLVFALIGATHPAAAAELEPIPRRLPPQGIELPAEDPANIAAQLEARQARLAKFAGHPLAADVEIYIKAVDYAVRHREFYDAKQIPLAYKQLDSANARLDELEKDAAPWTKARGLIVRGYRSSIDGSPQPYGLVVPEQLDLSQPVPLYVWLHGRGDTKTDLHFIEERETRIGQIAPENAIVVHPFGRQCIGWKSAGEIDVLEAIDHVASQYKIDPDKIVLMGFSMGGAGGWHIGAHYADRFVALSPGAGFAETARYNNLRPDAVPAVERTLWSLYDVPCYTRNLFNLPVVAYSGELDKQIQAARVMEEAFAAEGEKLPHIIGPGMGHKYHPDSLKEILARMDAAVQAATESAPPRVSLQTRTLRYHRMHWVSVEGLIAHWDDTRVDAAIAPGKRREITADTKNVSRIAFSPWGDMAGTTIVIDGQTVKVSEAPHVLPKAELVRIDGMWKWIGDAKLKAALAKRPGLQGPIDDVLMDSFLVVAPDGKSSSDAVQQWVEFELAHFADRWRSVYRGDLPLKKAAELTSEDIANRHLILWGDAASNSVVARLLDGKSGAHRLPLTWNSEQLEFNGQKYDSARHLPLLIYPNPLNPRKYVVLNSGMTFREAHDRTNSQQNPKLGDWAIVELREPPSDTSPGRVVASGFFDEKWLP